MMKKEKLNVLTIVLSLGNIMIEDQTQKNKFKGAIILLICLAVLAYFGTCKTFFIACITHAYFPTAALVIFAPLIGIDFSNEFTTKRTPAQKVEIIGKKWGETVSNAVLTISSLSLVKIVVLQANTTNSIFNNFNLVDISSLFISGVIIFIYAFFKTINSYQKVFSPSYTNTND